MLMIFCRFAGAVALISSTAVPAKPVPKSAVPNPDAALFAKARAKAAYYMKDPASAQFRNIRKQRTTFEEGWKVCGEINSKNSYGAYAGFSKFVYLPDSDTAFVMPSSGNGDDYHPNLLGADIHSLVGC